MIKSSYVPNLLFVFLVYLLVIGCKSNKSKVPELASIELLRGNITLCGSNQFGNVSFASSCSASTQESFDLAISLLHSFEYAEAEKAFVKVIDQDPNCAMAYWGVAMSIYHTLWKAPTSEELEKGSKVLMIAKSLQKTERENKYLEAIGAYYNKWEEIPHQKRALMMEEKMGKIYRNFPDDKEAAIFYALALNSTADPKDKTYKNRRKAGAILEAIFPDQPNHPGIAHYIIHNYDNPKLANLALPTARKYAQIAPSSAHAQHMPSHIFTRLGLWDESIQSNLNSASSAMCYAEQTELEGNWTSEIHALDYLFYAHLQKGDNESANELFEYFKKIEKVSGNNASISYPFAAIPARMVLENKEWSKAAKLKLHQVEMQWDQFPWEKSIYHFARVLGASRVGDLSSAEKDLAIMVALHKELVQLDEQYKANQVAIQVKASQAWIQVAKGNNEEALTLMKASADMENETEKHPVTPGEVLPARELLGDLLMAINRPAEALTAYEVSNELSPNRFNGIYGAARAAKALGDRKKTAMYFEKLLRLTENSQSERPETKEAKDFIRLNKS
ncbi:MAG: hypothetical protein HEP71_26935 [Roseivirga sp.]|nr:hypothetical protein [Roseivirga sp.]